jgi:sec-independent protein translocase protein TatC
VFSQVMVAIPMIALYELSILLCGIFYKQRITAPKDDEDEDDDEDDDDDDDADTKSDKAPKKASV